jgi:hypothetical protein
LVIQQAGGVRAPDNLEPGGWVRLDTVSSNHSCHAACRIFIFGPDGVLGKLCGWNWGSSSAPAGWLSCTKRCKAARRGKNGRAGEWGCRPPTHHWQGCHQQCQFQCQCQRQCQRRCWNTRGGSEPLDR